MLLSLMFHPEYSLNHTDALVLGSFGNYVKLPNAEKPSRSNEGERQGKKQAQKKAAKKRKIADKEADEEEAGSSSGSRQKKAATEPKSCELVKM